MFFAPPSELTAEVFARVPAELAPVDASGWARVQHPGKTFRAFLEGPSFDRDGNLYCVDICHGRILRFDPQGDVTVAAEYDGEPNGLKIHRDGRIFIADHAHGLMVMDPVSGKVEPFLTRPGLERFHGLNDLHFALNGDLWFTDQGQSGLHAPYGRLFRLTADGALDCVIDNIPSPNGLCLNEDESQLFLAVTRANAVWRVRFLPDGRTVAKSGTFIQLSGGLAGPDGLALGTGGELAIGHMGLGTVWIMSRLGEPMFRIRSPEGLLTANMAFGGPEGRHLYITEASTASILRVELPFAGKPMFALS
ncbi:SMP-30/gluconolactonase/LRE family protein [Salipiger mangrovisoli]|uniref:SMP-30/gluconolactonase/LRE family protein n=1 Tax=Salipiger mangrovisoli TaxID=2865933 RepID=A0ABR9X7Q0_9RHOB|nr:SMP-30/gluconolactonase/LRE family protein [Salipiger mangrovisoli]MBE9639624.1 SMP-30/gluconolactonase/LRE family protein [Salipiger mangrovisoli]